MPVRDRRRSVVIGWFGLLVMLNLVGCGVGTPETIKIGLVAPFEGRYREIGYDVIPAVRLAIREFASTSREQPFIIELVAYDDGADPAEAIEQANRLTADPEVAIVIGHWRDDTTRAALEVYARAGLPVITYSGDDLTSTRAIYNLAPSSADLESASRQWLSAQQREGEVWSPHESDVTRLAENFNEHGFDENNVVVGGDMLGLQQFFDLTAGRANGVYFVTGLAQPQDRADSGLWTDEAAGTFTTGFTEGSLGTPPGPYSTAAYEAAWLAISIIADEYGVTISNTLIGDLGFGVDGRRLSAPIFLYEWQSGQRLLVSRLR